MENQIEIWKDIPGYEGLYQVSNLGRIKSLERIVFLPNRKITRRLKEKITSGYSYKGGYPVVNLYSDYNSKIKQIHRIVAEVFLENKYNLPYVNHKNGIKNDPRLENLEWCTHLHNMQHAFSNDLVPNGERNHKAKLSDKKVIAIKRLFRINPKTNQSKIAKKLKVGRSTINAIYKEKKWKYVN